MVSAKNAAPKGVRTDFQRPRSGEMKSPGATPQLVDEDRACTTETLKKTAAF
jgi:hypothetical protein